jgi:hypothetical protein
MYPSGDAIVVWSDYRDGLNYQDIYAQKINSTGDPQWGANDKRISLGADDNWQMEPDISLTLDGNAYVVWEDYRDLPSDIYAQFINSTGDPQWGATDLKVNQHLDDENKYDPRVVVDSNGNAIIIWDDNRNGVTGQDIYAQKLNSTGAPLWDSSDKRVNQNLDTSRQSWPDIAINSEDYTVIVWSDWRNGTNDRDIYAQKLDSEGNAQWGSTDKRINQNPDNANQSFTKVTFDSNGDVVIVWDDERNGTDQDDIYAQKITDLENTGGAYIFLGSDQYSYVTTNSTTYGFITDFANAKSASDSGAYSILTEYNVTTNIEIFNETFVSTANPWDGTGQDESWSVVSNTDLQVYNSGPATWDMSSPSGAPWAYWNHAPSGSLSTPTAEIFYASIDLSGYTDVKIEYYWQTDDPDSGEGFFSSYSTDSTNGVDGTWNTMYTHNDPVDDAWTKDGPYSIPEIDAVSTFKLRFAALFDHVSTENIGIDDIKVTGNKTPYKMDIEFNTDEVPAGNNYYLELNYSVDGTETDFGVLVYNSSGSWDDLGSQGDLDSTSFTTEDYYLSSFNRLPNGNIRVRFIGRNESNNDETNSSLSIEYLRIRTASAYLLFLGENGSNRFGWSVANTSDVNQDGEYDDVIIGAPGYNNNTGRAYIYFGGSAMDDSSDVNLTGENPGDKFGYSVHFAGDIDGDNDPDVIVGAPYFDNGTNIDCGKIYIFCGGIDIDSASDYNRSGEFSGDHFGWSVSLAGDVNNDGYNDTITGAPHYKTRSNETPPLANNAGKAYANSMTIGEPQEGPVIPEYSTIFGPILFILFLIIINRKRRKFGNKNGK